MTAPFLSPTTPASSRTEVFVRYLDYFRSRLGDKLAGLPPGDLRTSGLSSGWAARRNAIIEAHDLAEAAQPGERWDGAAPATLERVLFHLLQEYARHLGHLDIVAELATEEAGE